MPLTPDLRQHTLDLFAEFVRRDGVGLELAAVIDPRPGQLPNVDALREEFIAARARDGYLIRERLIPDPLPPWLARPKRWTSCSTSTTSPSAAGRCAWFRVRTIGGKWISLPTSLTMCVMANRQTVTRNVGFAIIRVDKHFTIDEVVFAKRGDLQLLGTWTLERFNLTVHPREKRLVTAGSVLAA